MQKSVIGFIFSILGGLILLFLLAPLVKLFLSVMPEQYFSTIQDPEVIHSIGLTLWVSLASTLVFSVGAVPLAYLMARKSFPGKSIVQSFIDLPIVIPHSAAGIALLGFLSRDTTMGKIASSVGLDFVGHPLGIGVAMAYVSLPFLINAARNGFQMVPVRLEKAALVLGASPIKVFFTISLPLAGRSVVSGLVMMFARGLSEFGAIVIIAYYPMVTPIMIWERFGTYGLQYAQPVAAIFIAVCLIFFILLRMLAKEKLDDTN
jgi:molybdate/tungstate transport system permease protein